MTPAAAALRAAAACVRAGGVVAYPTEAVFGLGCDPRNDAAVRRILAIKRRPADKGLILIAHDIEQLAPYCRALPEAARRRVAPTWPGPHTWLLPARGAWPLLTGAHATLAVRVTAHPLAAALCRACDTALVSTSANRAGRPPARTAQAARRLFGDEVDYVLAGEVGGRAAPTPITDALTGRRVRA